MKTAIPIQSLPVRLFVGRAADLEALGQFPLANSLRPLHSDVLPLLFGQALSLIEFRHHSLKASTIRSRISPLAETVSKSSARDRNFKPAWCRPSITWTP